MRMSVSPTRYWVESTSAANLDLLLVAVKKERITDQTSVITMAGKNPVVVDVDAFALQNAYEINYDPVTPRSHGSA